MPEIACSDSLARVRQWSTARGNSRSSTRKLTTFTGEIRPCRWRYISSALADRNSADHWMSSSGVPTSASLGSRMKYFTSRMRDVLSARSSSRPKLAEVPGLAVRHRGVGDAQELLAGDVHLVEELVRIVEHVCPSVPPSRTIR